ncbi:uncharacterized protein UTRI_02128_B [Ustilago trichophora]|uniref:DUF427 domain-containing protein n=1 Tax=Ustilago trichophora TaxID=86804 RepID=A0A5C3DUH9_9BASI|nr:uncharacterized protein UTRI_02128_B [Ustilago trichophora]
MSSSTPSASKPPHRIIVKPLGRQLTITTLINGRRRTLVDTSDALQLAESNYPIRFYFPRDALQWSFALKPSDHNETYCPFKGFAQYHDIAEAGSRIGDLKGSIWSYSTPFTTSDAYDVRGHFCLAAPSNQFDVKIDGRAITQDDAKRMNDSVLAASPSTVSSPSLPRDVLEEERRSRSTKRSTSATLQPPVMKRSASSGSNAPPQSFPIARPLGGELEIDSTNPVLADMIYRLDDEDQEEERHPSHHHEAESSQNGDNAGGADGDGPSSVDDHLLWFKDQPWYRRPSEKWLRPFALLIATAGGMCMGPKLELLNMFVCEEVLGDSYVGGGDIIVPRPSTNSSTTHLAHGPSHLPSGVHLKTFQPWLASSSSSAAGIASDADAVTSYLAALEQPNSTVIPVPKRPSKACFASPEVQSSLATLQLRMTLSMGILAALTTGFWSNLSSRRGRLPVLRISMIGIVFTDLVILTAALVPRSKLPFGYSFLVLGTTLEGLLGGYSAAIAIHQSYISDVTPSGTRAHIFAHFMGIVYAGLALGPTLGGLIVKHTDNILAPFWFALAMHLLYVVGIFTFIPESTSKEFRAKALQEYKESRAEIKRKADERKTAELQPLLNSSSWEGDRRPFKKRAWKRVKVMFMDSVLYAPLEPLSFLLPKKVIVNEEEEPEQHASSGASTPRPGALAAPEASASHISVSRVAPKTRYDYNLSFLSLTYFTETAIIGIMSFKMQYAQEQFIWGSAELGMYLTFLSITRVLALTFILPVAIKFLHRPVKALRLPQDGPPVEEEQTVAPDSRRQSTLDDEGRPHRRMSSYGALDQSRPVNQDSEDGQQEDDAEWDDTKKSVEELWTLRAKHLRLIHDSKFDLKLAKISCFVNTVSYALLIFSNTPQLFFLATAITSLGGGGGAAMSSLALALLKSPADAGKLFGAWSITSAISGTVVGPILFAEVFKRTTKTFPPAIFVVGTGMFVIAFLLLCCVKVRKPISLPPLPARPHPAPGMEERTEAETTSKSAYRSSTFKNAFSMKTAKRRDGTDAKTSRPGLPAFD